MILQYNLKLIFCKMMWKAFISRCNSFIYTFPKSFKFGWSQAGFQSEMGTPWSEDSNSDTFGFMIKKT